VRDGSWNKKSNIVFTRGFWPTSTAPDPSDGVYLREGLISKID
jgi:hypothetical protein